MDKNSIIGFTLIGVVLVGFSYLTRPSEEEMKQQQAANDSIASVTKARENSSAQQQKTQDSTTTQKTTAIATDTTSLFYAARQGENKPVVLQNDLVKLTLSPKGGVVTEAEMKTYKSMYGGNVKIFQGKDAGLKFMLAGKNENIVTDEMYFKPVNATDSTVTMQLVASNGGVINFNYKLLPHSYMVNFTIEAQGLSNMFSPTTKSLAISCRESARQQEKGYDFENRYSSLTYKKSDGGSDNLSETKETQKDVTEKLDWIAFKNQFFSMVFIGHQGFTKSSLSSTPQTKESGYLKDYSASMETFFDPTGKMPTNMQFYFGPNKYRLLQATNKLSTGKTDLEMEDLVFLGWPLFRYVNQFFIIYVFDWLSGFGLPMGVVLLLLTLVVKALVYPATRKSFMSSAKMRVLKPKIDEIAAKYPNQEDNMKKQQETMQLYSQYGVSPMGGCLPALIQMPIWIALFNFVPNAIELRGQSFLWAKDLSSYDDVIHWSHSVWGLGNHLSIFCVLFCLATVANTWISMRQQKDSMVGQNSQMKMMQWMMYLMPFMFFFMFNNYSSGLNYYYFISSFISIIIMWILYKRVDDKKLLAQLEKNYKANKSNPNRKSSGLAARLEALQKQQEAMAEAQKKKREK
jgi:YidC/Oxa1 family membrane protein insertase